jgi:outer membrane protein assembly factor BamB/PKD repeat protein
MKQFLLINVWLLTIILCTTSDFLLAQDNSKKENPDPIPLINNFSGGARTNTPSTLLVSHPSVKKYQKYSYIVVTAPSHGKIVFSDPEIYTGSGIWAVYTSDKDYVGTDTFSWKINNGYFDSNVATVSLNIIAGELVPTERTMLTLTENTFVEFDAPFRGGGGIIYQVNCTKPENGTIETNGLKLKYTPKPNYSGTDSFTFKFSYYSMNDTKQSKKETVNGICAIVIKKKNSKDWPQWRADEVRSGYTSMELPAKLNLLWQRDIAVVNGAFTPVGSIKPRIFPDIDYCRPVQLDKTLYVPETASDALAAYETDTGNLKWRYYASGVVRRPPAATKLLDGSNAVIFASDDGYIYCIDEKTGKERWKFQAAPNHQKAMGFGRLSSVWPIWASPAIYEGKVYFAAGYIPTYCLYAYCLDVNTGKIIWENDGRIYDMWNTSALGPIAISIDHTKMYGSVEGAARPWVVDTSTGEYLGHFGIDFSFPGGGKYGKSASIFSSRSGLSGWYSDGQGSYNIPEPKEITVGSKIFTFKNVLELGVEGSVASLLAGDDKLFVTTVEGKIYCFGSSQTTPVIHPLVATPLVKTTDEYTTAVAAMLSRNDLKFGLAYVLGLGNGRIVEELALQSSLSIVVVDPNHDKLQALRKKMDAAGLSGLRVSTLEGNPLEILFAPHQAAIITSEDINLAGFAKGQKWVESLYNFTRPFGGEIWLPTSETQNTALTSFVSSSKIMPLMAIVKQKGVTGFCDSFTQIKRTGLPDEKLQLKPPFGLIAFGNEAIIPPYMPLVETWPGKETYSLLPFKEKLQGYIPPVPKHTNEKGYPSAQTVSTTSSVFTSLINPLFSKIEKFSGLPSSGNDGACGVNSSQYGDYGLTHGKISSIFDTSSSYWGRLFFSEIGGCPGRISAGKGLVTVVGHPVPGSACGCSATMQFTSFVVTPMPFEENWINYQTVRSSNAIEETPIQKIGINFGGRGDRFIEEENLLWSHHPYSGRYGRISYNGAAKISALPMVPVSYGGKVVSVYHHSASMNRENERYRGWVAASYVKGMREMTIPLMQPVVALKTETPPKIDGDITDACWDGQRKVVFSPEYTQIDPDRDLGVPKINDECFAMIRYDNENLYIASGINRGFFGKARKYVTVTLNSRERISEDIVLTCENKLKRSTGINITDWVCAEMSSEKFPYAAEISIPWVSIAKAGLWKEQLVINLNLSGGILVSQFTPVYFDMPKGLVAESKPHTIRLYFAEMEGKKVGERIFEIDAQGKNLLKNFDVVKEAGAPKKEIMKEFKNIEISDVLKLSFKAQNEDAMLSGIEIIGTYNQASRVANVLPNADMQASVVSGTAPLKVLFNAQKSNDSDGQIEQCVWEFGDGRLAKGSVLEHVYAEPGTYPVNLLVRDNRGGLATKQLIITVQPGLPASFICSIKAKGGDFSKLSEWEAAMKSDLTSSSMNFKLTEVGTNSYQNASVTFTGGASGVIRKVTANVATIANIKGTPAIGKGVVSGNLKFAVGDVGVSIGRSLLFIVSNKGNYEFGDNGKTVTFTGGGKGILKHINGSNIAYITECLGEIQVGKVTLDGGHTFEIGDLGNPVYSIVAECYYDWPNGLEDHLKTNESTDWFTDELHTVMIRSAKGQKNKVKIKGEFDCRGIPNLIIENIMFDSSNAVYLGKNSSVNRSILGNTTVWENTIIANSIAGNVKAENSNNIVNKPVSYFTIALRDGRKPLENLNIQTSGISFYNCTADQFDPAGQPGVEFVNCLSKENSISYNFPGYAELSYVNNCIMLNGTTTTIFNSEGQEKIMENQTPKFSSDSDFHLSNKDTTAKGTGGVGLGADVDGETRNGPTYDIGADAVSK